MVKVMRNYFIADVIIILFGLLIAFGPYSLFRACKLTEEGIPLCHWSSQAEIGMGFIIAFLGLLLIFFKELKIKIGLLAGIILADIVSLAIPHVLIGGCSMMSMRCRRITFPALTVVSVVLLIVTIVYIFSIKNNKESNLSKNIII